MIKMWGRNTSSNVQKAMWAVGELKLPHERIDIGGSSARTMRTVSFLFFPLTRTVSPRKRPSVSIVSNEISNDVYKEHTV